MKVFGCSASLDLAAKICEELKISLGDIYSHTFPSQEKYIQYKENIRGKKVYLVQSLGFPANDNLMELLVAIDAARRASAAEISVVCPWICYSRAERKDKPRISIAAKLVMDMIAAAGADRILTMDLHTPALQGFSNLPMDQLYAMPVFVDYLRKNRMDNLVVVSPDEGAVKRSYAFASVLKADFAFHSKKRTGDAQIESRGLIGDVSGKNVLIYDDLLESCGTLIGVAKVCKENGAKTVTAMVAHNCITKIGIDRLKSDEFLDKLVTTDSIFCNRFDMSGDRMQILTVSGLFAEAIKRIDNSESISDLFESKGW